MHFVLLGYKKSVVPSVPDDKIVIPVFNLGPVVPDETMDLEPGRFFRFTVTYMYLSLICYSCAKDVVSSTTATTTETTTTTTTTEQTTTSTVPAEIYTEETTLDTEHSSFARSFGEIKREQQARRDEASDS